MAPTEGHQEYIQKKINPILENLVTQLLLERPEDPVPFMIQWLSEYAHVPSSTVPAQSTAEAGEVARLQSEVESLRSYIKDLEAKQAAADAPDLPQHVPSTTTTKEEEDSADESSDDDDDVVDELPPVPASYHHRGPRASVSAEAYGEWNKKRTDFVAPVYPKTEEQKERIKNVLNQSFLFMSIDEKSLDVVIGAMVEKVIEPKQRVINQGDDGDVLYVIESGELDCYKRLPGQEEEKLVKTCTEGDAFGELALLYNTPRAASVEARGRCVVWQLDRETFNHIVKEAAANKREKHEAFLKSVPLLESMDSYERSKIADALKTENYKAGECIVRQGDDGDKFYMIEEGECTVFKVYVEGQEPKEVMHLKSGDYFGELALLSNDPRAATVTAKTDCQVLSLDRRSFKRLLGPLEDILKRNTARYDLPPAAARFRQPEPHGSFSSSASASSTIRRDLRDHMSPPGKVDILQPRPMRRVFYEMERRRLERSLEGYRMEPGWGARFAAELVVVLVAFLLLSNSIGRNILGQVFPDKNNSAVFLVVPGVVSVFFILLASIRIALRRRSALSTLGVTALLIGVVWIIWLYDPSDKWPAASLKDIILVAVVVASVELLLILIYFVTHYGYPFMLKRLHPEFLVKYWWKLQPSINEETFGYSYQRYGMFSLTRNICNYHGDVDAEGRPHGFGVWMDDSRHGEVLKGIWLKGYPMGPFVSREFSSGSVSVCRRILWASTRAEPGIDCKYIFPHRRDSCLYGLASVECSVSGYFFNHLPKVRELVTRTPIFDDVLEHFRREFDKADEEDLANGESFVGSERDACRGDCPSAPPALRLRLLTCFGALERGSSQMLSLKGGRTAGDTGFMELLPANADPEELRHNTEEETMHHNMYSNGNIPLINSKPSYLLPVRNAEALVYLHGYNCPISSAIKRLGQMLALGQFPLWIRPFVFSQSTGSALTYHAARDCLPQYAPDLADFVQRLRAAGFRRVHFLVHSMGARLFLEALPLMIQDSLLQIRACSFSPSVSGVSTQGSTPAVCTPTIDLETAVDKGDRMTLLNVILVNADYPLDKFRYAVLPSLLEYCERVTVYSDSRDGALMWSELFNREKALGKFVGTLSCVDEKTGQRYGESYIDVMDTTHMDQNVHQLRHNFFNLNVQVVSDIAEIVQSCTPAVKRNTRLTKTGRGNVFTFLSPPSFVKNN
ncbi:hypothetical protein FOL47_001598 [Perkinsus chesapeaki]|uniref:cAMP-dependent protein kinase regulatory subunit n=1 Tax=Perkinsus chesapeaki TaxID=330153 RepID=A0A7J6MIE7_PERCH|nr:hypothetical protein FOL47_001598 [Perkinsus chesapeaki]